MPNAWVYFPGAPYTHRAALDAAQHVVGASWEVVDGKQDPPSDADATPTHYDAYIADYDYLPFEALAGSSARCSSYMIRKALIRKHYLAHAIHTHSVKHPESPLMVPRTWMIDIQFADELDELLADDLYDVREALEQNEVAETPKWFILKPGMADQANGIRLFSSVEQLEQIFEEFEDDGSEEDEDDTSNAVMASQLRHFVIQEYIASPLLLSPADPSLAPRKFHLRAYVTCVGGLQVYLHDDMLALFASMPYTNPQTHSVDLRGHLSNTCFGKRHTEAMDGQEGNVFRWQDLIDQPACMPGGSTFSLTRAHVDHVRQKAVDVIGSVFGAVARESSIHWQLWPNAFEIFGVDLLVSLDTTQNETDPASLQVWLLEINAVCIRP